MKERQKSKVVGRSQRIADLEEVLGSIISSPHKHKESCVVLEVSQEDIDYAVELLQDK